MLLPGRLAGARRQRQRSNVRVPESQLSAPASQQRANESSNSAGGAGGTRRVLPGEYAVTSADETLATVLGSCISACIRDPFANVGGMNHFMLPENKVGGNDRWLDPQVGLATRYGSHAMERLINDLLKSGARRERLEIKLFGGGQILASQTEIGRRNIAFIRDYLAREGLKITAEDLGGNMPRMLAYRPRCGKAMVKHLRPIEATAVAQSERAYMQKIDTEDQTGDVELFE
jgi:chemotaxis protein CheD